MYVCVYGRAREGGARARERMVWFRLISRVLPSRLWLRHQIDCATPTADANGHAQVARGTHHQGKGKGKSPRRARGTKPEILSPLGQRKWGNVEGGDGGGRRGNNGGYGYEVVLRLMAS